MREDVAFVLAPRFLQCENPAVIQNNRHKRIPPSRAGIDVDPVTVMGRLLYGRMAVDDQCFMIAEVPKKLVSDP